MKVGDILILKEDKKIYQYLYRGINTIIEVPFKRGQRFEVNFFKGVSNKYYDNVIYIKSFDVSGLFFTNNIEYFITKEEYREYRIKELNI